MKRYQLFVGERFYPLARLGDYKGCFETSDEAIEAGKMRNARSVDEGWAVVAYVNDSGFLESIWEES